jgi:hypothetical protein
MDKVKAVLSSKTFWGGVAMLCGAVYAAYQGNTDEALGLAGAALAAWGLRHKLSSLT